MKNGTFRRPAGFAVELANTLRGFIEEGVYPKGEQLPTEQELVNEFGVSRSVVREAITILKTDGIIETFQGRGSFVSSEGPPSTFRFASPDLEDDAAIAETLEFLVAHEVAATGLAALRRSNTDIRSIKQALDEMAQAIRNNESGVEQDLQFHQRIVFATRNAHFISFNNFLENGVRKLIRAARTNTSRFSGLAETVHAEHQEIYDAIVAGDRDRAETAAETHLRNAADRLKIYNSDGIKAARRPRTPSGRPQPGG
jgi:DNA-binding FadR family transcriptional regulator